MEAAYQVSDDLLAPVDGEVAELRTGGLAGHRKIQGTDDSFLDRPFVSPSPQSFGCCPSALRPWTWWSGIRFAQCVTRRLPLREVFAL